MVVLQFAFDGDGTNVHRPHNHYENSICYPGTHDNDTAVGWYKSTSPETRATFKAYSGMEDERKVAWEMIRVGMASVSHTCIFCFQDILSLGSDARMNTPGVADGANYPNPPLPALCVG
jgi:4-alpha-glucanotransferase